MSVYESQNLLGNSSTLTPKIVAGTIAGACIATVFLSTSTSSLYVAPTASSVSQLAGVASQPLLMTQQQAVRTVVAAAPAGTEYEVVSTSQTSASWAPLAAMAAIPMALVAAVAAFRPAKKAIVDPIDMMTASGTQWAMMATSGEAAVAKNYASALVELGQEGQCLEQLHSDMDNFGSLLTDEAFSSFFNNPMLVGEKQKEIIGKLCEEANMSPITKNFLSFLVDSKRIAQLPAIIKEFDEQFYEVTGTQVATVTAAVALSEEQLRLIANKLHEITKGKNIKIKSQVNPDLLAGFILEYGRSGSQRIDLSLRGQLAELRGELQQGIRTILTAGVPAGVQLVAAALGVNALLAASAHADSGNIFDFGLTMPIQMVQFLLLMVFLEKTVFTPVGKVIDERAELIRKQTSQGSDNSKEIAALNAQAEQLLEAARRDAAKELEKAKKEANAQGAEKLAKAKADLEASLKSSLAEVEKSKAELWAKLEAEVLPVLADDIVNKLLQESPAAAAAATTSE